MKETRLWPGDLILTRPYRTAFLVLGRDGLDGKRWWTVDSKGKVERSSEATLVFLKEDQER